MIIGSYSAHCLFAEYVRPESESRSSLIGVYPSTIKVSAHETVPLPFGVFLMVQPVPPEGTKIKIRLTINGQTLLDIPNDAPKETDKDESMPSLNVAISGPPFPVKEDSKFEVLLKIGEFEEARVGVLDVKRD